MKVEFAPGFMKSASKCFSNRLRYRIPRIIRDIKYEIIYAWQRVFKGHDVRWYFSTYSMLNDVMIKSLKELKKHHYGYPAQLKGKDKEWKQVLSTIIKGFEASIKLSESDYMVKTKEKHMDGPFKGMYKSKIDRVKEKKLNKEFEDGMKLFVEHYFSLWD